MGLYRLEMEVVNQQRISEQEHLLFCIDFTDPKCLRLTVNGSMPGFFNNTCISCLRFVTMHLGKLLRPDVGRFQAGQFDP